MSVSSYFPGSYVEARAKFRDAARGAGAILDSYRNPAPGPTPEALGAEGLSTDCAWLGPAGAHRLVIAMSATHGVEGFCGSGIQVGWLAEDVAAELPADTALMLVHAINPYGFAWLRRVNEDNVDLNRNFVDHKAPYPANPGYEALRDSICPRAWDAATLAEATIELDAYGARHGAMALQSAISSGQYAHPEGVFYGGRGPVWSHRTLVKHLRRRAAQAANIAFIDLHTGLGPHGHGEIIGGHTIGMPGHARVAAWFDGEATSPEAGSSSSAVVTGDTLKGISRSLPAAELTGITLEYGTRPLEEVLEAVRADNWLHLHGDLASPQGKAIKAQIRAAFYPDTDEWKELVWARAADVFRRVLRGLT